MQLGPRRALVLLTVLVGAAATVSPAHAAFPGRNGRIAFDGIITASLWSNADGLRLLARGADHPRHSRYGGMVAYGCGTNVGDSCRRGVGIRIGRSSGQGRPRVITHSRFDSWPDWSPSGKSIVFTRYPGGPLDPPEIWIYRRGRSSRLTKGEQPAWSVKGEIVFTRDVGPKGEEGDSGDFADIYVVRPNGKGLRRLTQGFEPEWSPRGSKIIFSTNACGYSCLYTIQRDGRLKRRIGRGIGGEQPDFSPDGGQVVFAGANQILVMRSNGTRERVVFETATDLWVSDPDWQSLPRRRRSRAPAFVGRLPPSPRR